MAGQNSQVKAIGDVRRPQELAFNTYSEANPYSPSHPNALSDGDRLGRGDYQGAVGTIDDIATRMRLLMLNKYTEANPYYVND